MRPIRLALSLSLALAAVPAGAQDRAYTPDMSCASVRALVAQRGTAVLATSPNAYDDVLHESGGCGSEFSARPAYVPSSDERLCFAGYRCTDRNNSQKSD